MAKLNELLWKVESDMRANNIHWKLKDVMENLIVILWETNDLYSIKNWEIKINYKCATWKNGFGNKIWSYKTPLWLHEVVWYYGDWLPKECILHWRVDTWKRLEYYPNYPNIYPVIISRILQLKWLEERNSNTLKRYIYIHWTPNVWYWDQEEFRKTYWCISLKPDDMINLFEQVKNKNTFVYIMN